jgi:hypothetical protein
LPLPKKVLSLLRNPGGHLLDLELEYDLNGPELAPPAGARRPGIAQRMVDIELRDQLDTGNSGEEEATENLFGFTLRGGAFGPDPVKSRPLTVTSIRLEDYLFFIKFNV